MFRFRCIFPFISSQPEGALPGTLWNVGVGAAPAGGEQTWPHALGRPWVSVRPDKGLPLKLAGRGQASGAKSPCSGRKAAKSPEERTEAKNRRDGTSRGVAVCLCFPAIRETSRGCYQGAPFGVPPPSFRFEGGFRKTQLTRRNLRVAMTLARRKDHHDGDLGRSVSEAARTRRARGRAGGAVR